MEVGGWVQVSLGFFLGKKGPETIEKSGTGIGAQLTILCSINRKLRSGDYCVESIPDRREPYRRVPLGRVHLAERRLDEVQ